MLTTERADGVGCRHELLAGARHTCLGAWPWLRLRTICRQFRFESRARRSRCSTQWRDVSHWNFQVHCINRGAPLLHYRNTLVDSVFEFSVACEALAAE